MITYLFMMLISCFACFVEDKRKRGKKYQIFTFLLAFIPLFVVSGFRYMVGRDYLETYVYTFYKIANNIPNVRIDVGFYFLNKIIIFFEGSYQWIFILTSLIINYIIVKIIFKESTNKFMSMYIYICGTLYFFSMNGIRQTISLVLFYYSLKYIENKNLKKYFLINIIGMTFHNSAIIFLPLYFCLSKQYSLKKKLIFILCILMSVSILVPFLNNILLTTKYAMYINNSYYNPLEVINLSNVINMLLFILYEIFFSKNKQNVKYNIYSNIHFWGIIISIFVTKISLAMRIFIYFRYIEFLSVPYLISKIRIPKKEIAIIKVGVILFYFAYFIHGVFIENGNTVLPYKCIFFK